jgi:hypothetical protein
LKFERYTFFLSIYKKSKRCPTFLMSYMVQPKMARLKIVLPNRNEP